MPVALPKSDRLASRSPVATGFLPASISLTTPVDRMAACIDCTLDHDLKQDLVSFSRSRSAYH
jgi:hypothetical protein